MTALVDLMPKGDVKGGAPAAAYASSVHVPKNGFVRSNLFIFLLGQTAAFVCWLVIGGVFYGRMDQRFSEMLDWKAQAHVRLEKIEREGGASGYVASNNEKRIMFLEEQTRKIDVMSEKISRIDEAIKRIDERK